MEKTPVTERRMRARDAALRMLNRLTLGAAFAAVAGLGVFSAVSAATIPGSSASTSPTQTSTSASTSTSTSSSSTLQASSGVSPSSGGGTAVTGASH